MANIKVVTVVGTRPEIIRLSRLIPVLDEATEHKLVHTGQNFDPNLSDVFFEDLGLREPDYHLGIKSSSLGESLGKLFPAIEKVFIKENPDAVMILGDTNSSLSSIIAERMGIPVYHMEAGNRSFDANVPEELNRKLVDHISSFNLPYTEFARRNLLAEGAHPRSVMMTGSPLPEVLAFFDQKIQDSSVLSRFDLSPGQYFLASFHREENVDRPENLRKILHGLEEISARWSVPVIASLHPRTAMRIKEFKIEIPKSLKMVEPLGFTDYCHLQRASKCVLSDSGTISEESAILGFPAVTVRESMERPEALEAGVIIMAGLEPNHLVDAVELVSSRALPSSMPAEYQMLDFSSRVLSQLLSTVHLVSKWNGSNRRING